MSLPINSTGPLCEAVPEGNPYWCAYHRCEHEPSADPEVEVTVTIRARVKAGYGEAETLDVVMFHLGLSDLDSVEADISAVHLIEARQTAGTGGPA